MRMVSIFIVSALISLLPQTAVADLPREGPHPIVVPELLDFIQTRIQMQSPKAACSSPQSIPSTSGKCSIFMLPDQLISRCLKGRSEIPSRKIHRVESYKCRTVLGVSFADQLQGSYELGVVHGRPQIRQRVEFYGFPDRSSEDYFRGMLMMNLDRIKRFYEQQGIDYELDFTTPRDGKSPAKEKRTRISIDFTNRRSNQGHWHLGYAFKERLKFANLSKGSVNRNADNDFVYVVIHELLHGLGIQDDYYKEGEACPEIYDKRNSHRPAYIPCPKEPDVICANIMAERSTDKNGALPIESIYQLLEPLCPGACDYDDLIHRPWKIDSPRVREL